LIGFRSLFDRFPIKSALSVAAQFRDRLNAAA
jgi:hypothetical protein